jgi:hypothetical protein
MSRRVASLHGRSFQVLLSFVFLLTAMAGPLVQLKAQSRFPDCDCTISDVRLNTVQPCDVIIGDVLRVRNAQEFRDAIIEANTRGGGVTILLDDGTYRVASTSWFPYLTASDVVIRGASGNRDAVILEGGGMRDVAPEVENGLLLAGDRVIIADLTIRDVGNHAIQNSGHNLVVHNVRVQNTYQQMIKGATERSTIDSGIVQCCLLEYTAGMGPQYYIGGLDIHKGHGWTVRDNVFLEIQSPSSSTAEHAVHFWNNCANNIVERNLIINCDRGIGFGLGDSPNTGGVIRNNMIFNSGDAPFADVGIGLETSPSSRVYNNTVFITYQNAIEFRFSGTRFVEVMNNLCNQDIRARDGATAMVSNNRTSADASWFVDASQGDLHLAAALDDLVDQGMDLAQWVRDDIDRRARPQGTGYDIGAHEYVLLGLDDGRDVESSLHVFPNPSKGEFSVRGLLEHGDIEVFDARGTLVLRERSTGGEMRLALPSARGAYFLVLRDATGRTVERRILCQ